MHCSQLRISRSSAKKCYLVEKYYIRHDILSLSPYKTPDYMIIFILLEVKWYIFCELKNFSK